MRSLLPSFLVTLPKCKISTLTRATQHHLQTQLNGPGTIYSRWPLGRPKSRARYTTICTRPPPCCLSLRNGSDGSTHCLRRLISGGMILTRYYSFKDSIAPCFQLADLTSLQWDASKVIHFASVVELSKIHWDITYYSTLTSLLRAPEMPGVATDISAECFQAARLSLQSHLRCFTGYGGAHWASKSEYINW